MMPKPLPLSAAACINKPDIISNLPECRPDKAESKQVVPPKGGLRGGTFVTVPKDNGTVVTQEPQILL